MALLLGVSMVLVLGSPWHWCLVSLWHWCWGLHGIGAWCFRGIYAGLSKVAVLESSYGDGFFMALVLGSGCGAEVFTALVKTAP